MLFFRRLGKCFKHPAERLTCTLGGKILEASGYIAKKTSANAILMGESRQPKREAQRAA